MTDKQNYFTYTDNTSDNNDKTIENLHKQMNIGQCPYEGECQLCKSACSVDVYCFIKQLFDERNIAEEELYLKNQECENWESLCWHADKQIDELEAENDKYIKVLVEIQEIAEFYANSTVGDEQEDGTFKVDLEKCTKSGIVYCTYDPRPANQILQKISEVLEQ